MNAGPAFDLRAVATSAESTYAGIVRLVEEAEKQKAPFVRLADRYALFFIPLTLVIAGLAWALSRRPGAGARRPRRRDAVPDDPGRADRDRGRHLSRGQARHHREGRRRARDARARHASCCSTRPAPSPPGPPRSPTSRCSATWTHRSCCAWPHRSTRSRPTCWPARSCARLEGTTSRSPSPRACTRSTERASRDVWMGGRSRSARRRTSRGAPSCRAAPATCGGAPRSRARAACSSPVDGRVAGALILDDPIRPDTPRVIRTLRRAGIRRVVMVTGDHPDVAESVGHLDRRGPDHVRARPGGQGRRGHRRARVRRDDHGRRRRERRAGARGGRRRRRDGCARGDRLVRGRRRRARRRPAGPARPRRCASRGARVGSRCRASSSGWDCRSAR